MEREAAVDPEELKAAIEARRELGETLEPHIVDSFVERIERKLDERRPRQPVRRHDSDKSLALAIISLCVAIPLTAIGVTQAGLAGLLIVWAGIVLVNVAYSLRR
jgi:hypothetical protein